MDAAAQRLELTHKQADEAYALAEQYESKGLRFHDLRGEFACRLLESRAELYDVRDFLGHANITTTSRYLKSTLLRLARALDRLERTDVRTSATPVPHDADREEAADADDNPQLADWRSAVGPNHWSF